MAAFLMLVDCATGGGGGGRQGLELLERASAKWPPPAAAAAAAATAALAAAAAPVWVAAELASYSDSSRSMSWMSLMLLQAGSSGAAEAAG